MASVTFPVEFGGSGITITDDADPQTGLDGTGYIDRFVPALKGAVDMTAHAAQKAGEANQSATTASEAAQQASDDRDSINLDLQTLNGLVSDADASANAAAGSATTASNMADAVAQATETYTSVSAGLADTVDTNYFRVIEAPEATRVSVYRNDAGSATPITTYYTKTGVDAKQAAAVRLNRSLQRLGDHGQTLHSDFNLAAYGLGTPLYGGVQDAFETAEGIWQTERLGGSLALQHVDDGSLKYVYVPPNTIAREWNPGTGQYQAQISGAVTNELLYSAQFDNAAWIKARTTLGTIASGSVVGEGYKLIASSDTNSTHTLGQLRPAFSGSRVFCFVGKAAEYSNIKLTVLGGTVQYGMGFNLSDGSTFAANIGGVSEASVGRAIHLGSGWYLCYIIVDVEAANEVRLFISEGSSHILSGDGTSGIYIAHAQLTQGDAPGPVIVTEGAPVTRATDNISRKLGAEFNVNKGTFFVEFYYQSGVTTAGRLVVLREDGGSITANSRFISLASGNSVRMESYLQGVSSGSYPLGTASNGVNRIALAWDGDNAIACLNGGTVVSAVMPVMPIDYYRFNGTVTTGAEVITNAGKKVDFLFPHALTAAQLQELTTL